jgi:hypothetical protein
MTRFLTVEGQMDGLLMPGTIATILSLTTFRTLRAGFVPWMFQFTWDETSRCMTWLISFEYMPDEVIEGSPTLFSMDEFAVQYCAGNGESTVALIRTEHTCI